MNHIKLKNISISQSLSKLSFKNASTSPNPKTQVKERLYVWGYTRLGALGINLKH